MIAQLSTVAFFAGLAAAVHAPVGDPIGNPITAPLIEVVPACKPYTIQWTPTTPNSVSLLLLRGPSTNVVPLGAPLAEGIANSGSFVWTPSSELEADTTHYGLQLIDDVTGQYQYSTQFGISKDLCVAEVSTAVEPTKPAAETTAAEGGYYGNPTEPTTTPAGYPEPSTTAIVEVPSSTTVEVPASTFVEVPASTFVEVPASTFIATGTGTGYPISSIIQPTKSLSVPASLKTTASATGAPSSTFSPPAEFTGAASNTRAGLGLVGAVAGLVFML